MGTARRKSLMILALKIFLISTYNIILILTLSPRAAYKLPFKGLLIEFESYLGYNIFSKSRHGGV